MAKFKSYKINIMTVSVMFFIFISIGCNDQNSYYDRPEWKELSIYKVLKNEGRFNYYLQCVDNTEYADILDGAGLYTVFAPNDEAFENWLAEKGYDSINDIPTVYLNKIVAYSIVYGKWTSDHLSDKISSNSYVAGAYKRKTVYYSMPYKDPEFNYLWTFDEPLEGSYETTVKEYQTLLTKQNYKYLPVFTDKYFNTNSLNAESDYLTFYPNSVYTGKNVDGGTIINEDLISENGVIYEVSTVNEPKKNIDEIINEPQFVGFNNLLDFQTAPGVFAFKKYEELPNEVLQTLRLMLPKENLDKVFVKSYSNNATVKLAFSPLTENIKAENVYDSESLGYTLFVPQNDILEQYIKTKLLKYYSSREQLPLEVISTLINTHMAKELVWGTHYQKTKNFTGEYLNGAGSTGNTFSQDGIIEKRMASNGFVYLIDHIVKSRFFETVYSEILLNPTHSWLNTAYLKYFSNGLREDLMKSILNDNPNQRYTILNFSDELLKQDGFNYSGENNTFSNSVANADTRLKRLMQLHIFPGQLKVQSSSGEINANIQDFDQLPKITQYESWSFLTSLSGDMVRYKSGIGMQAAGNIEDGSYVNFTKVNDNFNNGQAFNVDKMLEYASRNSATIVSEKDLWSYIDRARTENPNVKTFVDYLERCLKSSADNTLAGIKSENYYTILMPNNTAMTEAKNKGYIMPLDSITSDKINYLAQATKFVNAHILVGRVFPDDGLNYLYPVNIDMPDSIPMPTLLKITDEPWGLVNQSTLISVKKNSSGLLLLTPLNVKSAGMIAINAGLGTTTTLRIQRGKPTGSSVQNSYRSNRIASKAVIHEINNFFTFTVSERN
ncbi:MAG: fasciclin domain-containing protein [Paludibacter sp.]|nr:fasciclin domain-containing protein [Paludibacter sp.]